MALTPVYHPYVLPETAHKRHTSNKVSVRYRVKRHGLEAGVVSIRRTSLGSCMRCGVNPAYPPGATPIQRQSNYSRDKLTISAGTCMVPMSESSFTPSGAWGYDSLRPYRTLRPPRLADHYRPLAEV